MANQNLYSRYVPEGVNRGNEYFVQAILGVSCANSDTITITTPDGVDTLLPIVACAYKPLSGTVTPCVPLTLTSIDQTNKVCVVTNGSGGAIAAGSRVVIRFIGG